MCLGDSAEDLKLNILGFLFQMRQTQTNASSQVHVCSCSCEQRVLRAHTQREVVALLPPALLFPGALILQAMLTTDAFFQS